jgi:hypothetical protein
VEKLRTYCEASNHNDGDGCNEVVASPASDDVTMDLLPSFIGAHSISGNTIDF